MSKLLIIAYKSPPVLTPAGLRLHHISVGLAKAFEQIHVVTANHQGAFGEDPYLTGGTPHRHTVAVKDIRTLTQRGTFPKSVHTAPIIRQRLRAFFTKGYHAYPLILLSGDGGYTYMRQSYRRAVQLIESEGITHLFSSYRPWADHIVCYRLKRRFPHLVWIADFRDLVVDPVRRDVWWPGLQRWYQRRLLRRADVVTTVSDGLARRLRKDHPRVVVLRNGIDQLPNGFLTAPDSAHFTITYTGSIYPGLQSAAPLLALLRDLINEGELNPAHLELHYAGKDGNVWEAWMRQYGLQPYAVQHGMLPVREAEQLQARSQMNLLLSWSAPGYGGIMTAKLGSYLSAGRPIIALLNGPADPEMSHVVEATGGGRVFPSHEPGSPARLRQFLLDAYRTWQFSGALPWRVDPQQLQPYTWDTQLKHLADNLSNE